MSPEALELAAARMTRTLARQPRKAKTRAYVASLPKREKIVVSPNDYPLAVTRAEARLDAALQKLRDKQRYESWVEGGKKPSPTIPPASRKDRIRPRVRQRAPLLKIIAHAQGMVCAICGEHLEFGVHPHEPERVTYDHVIPRALGGADHNNRVAAHKGCNHKKAARPPTGCERLLLAAVNVHLERHYAPPAQRIEARSDETPADAVQPEGREPDGEADAPRCAPTVEVRP